MANILLQKLIHIWTESSASIHKTFWNVSHNPKKLCSAYHNTQGLKLVTGLKLCISSKAKQKTKRDHD